MPRKVRSILYAGIYITALLLLVSTSLMLIADGLNQKETEVKKPTSAEQESSNGETLAISDVAPRTTTKPIPTSGQVIHVAPPPVGSDAHLGTSGAPKGTISGALSIAQSGATIAVRGGVYRESLGTVGKRVTIQAYPNEQVWIDGAVHIPANEWVKDGAYWRKDNWNTNLQENCYDAGLISPTSVAHLPDMLFVDGSLLAQVKSLAEMGPLRFYVDNANDKLYTSVNPAQYYTEATKHANALTLIRVAANYDASGSEVHGIGFRRFGSHQKPGAGCPNPAQVLINGSSRTHPMNIKLKDVTFYYGSGAGVSSFTNTGTTIENASFIENGFNGLQVHNTHNFAIRGSLLTKNNRENFLISTLDGGTSAQVAGSKMTTSTNITVATTEFSFNRGSGFWCDLGCDGVTFVRNKSTSNLSTGAFFETNRNITVGSNIFALNNGAGLRIAAENVRVYNNTFYKNQQSLSIYEDGREPGEATFPTTSQITLKNNLFVDATGAGNNEYGQPARMVNIRADHPSDSAKRNPEDVMTYMDYNMYVRSGSAPSRLIGWQGLAAGGAHHYTSLGAFKSAESPYEASSKSADGLAVNSLFTNAGGGDFHLRPGSPAINAGKPLTPVEAFTVGVSANSYVDAGVLSATGFAFTPTDPNAPPVTPPPTPPPVTPPTEPPAPPIATAPEEQLVSISVGSSSSGGNTNKGTGAITIKIPDAVCAASEKIEHEVDGQLVETGCDASIDTSHLSDGEHELTTRITGKDGSVREIKRTIAVSTPSLFKRLTSRSFLQRLALASAITVGGFISLSFLLIKSGQGRWLEHILERIITRVDNLSLRPRLR